MQPEQYRQSLIEQGYSEAEATNFTQTYYPEFQSGAAAPAQAAAPGFGAPMGGGFGAPMGGVAAGGSAAGTAAVAAGGSKVMLVSGVVAILLVGGGTAGYFIWDAYFSEDLHEGVYWSQQGFGLSFAEDDLKMVMPIIDGGCELYEEDMGEEMDEKDGLCFMTPEFESSEWKEHDDGEKLCVIEDLDEEPECMVLIVRDGGAIMYMEDDDEMCQILVKDIENPPERDTEDSYDDTAEKMDSWMEDFFDKAKEIGNDDPPSACDDAEWVPDITGDYESPYEMSQSQSGSLDVYSFSDADAAGSMGNSTGDALVEITMTQGSDLGWALLKVTISVDGGTPMACGESVDTEADCTWAIFGGPGNDQAWEVGEGITISEGDSDLCDGGNGGCSIDVTIIKGGVGNDSDKMIASINAYADAGN